MALVPLELGVLPCMAPAFPLVEGVDGEAEVEWAEWVADAEDGTAVATVMEKKRPATQVLRAKTPRARVRVELEKEKRAMRNALRGVAAAEVIMATEEVVHMGLEQEAAGDITAVMDTGLTDAEGLHNSVLHQVAWEHSI
jgi:hypothetical protein